MAHTAPTKYHITRCDPTGALHGVDEAADRGIVQADGLADFGKCISMSEIGPRQGIQCGADEP